MWIFRPEKLHQKRTRKQQGFYDHRNYIEKSTSKKNLNILTSKISTWKIRGQFRPVKLRQKKQVETTWIFRPAKLHRKKYMKTM